MNGEADRSPGPVRNTLLAAAIIGLTLLVPHLLAEIALCFLPVADGLALPVNAAAPVFRLAPNENFLFSRDWNFSLTPRQAF